MHKTLSQRVVYIHTHTLLQGGLFGQNAQATVASLSQGPFSQPTQTMVVIYYIFSHVLLLEREYVHVICV
jgi:hypothetical protein